jgi:uncharacterized protein
MMRAARALVLGLCAVLAAACATPSRTPAPPPVYLPDIWEIERDGGGWVRILPTVHLLPPGSQWLTREIADSLIEADVVVLEYSAYRRDSGLGIEDYLAKRRIRADNRAAFSSGEWDLIARRLAPMGVSVETVATRPLWASCLMLFVLPQPGGSSEDERAGGVDPQIDQLLNTPGFRRPQAVLETPESRFAAFSTMSDAGARACILHFVSREAEPGFAARMDRKWSDGEIDALRAAFVDGLDGLDELERQLLQDRERRWTDAIIANTMRYRRIFVLVGAAHLGGDGLLEMLAARGFPARRIDGTPIPGAATARTAGP